jgi:hypothetical protein
MHRALRLQSVGLGIPATDTKMLSSRDLRSARVDLEAARKKLKHASAKDSSIVAWLTGAIRPRKPGRG